VNGAESLVHTLLANGVTTCFANPGTSEMHFVAALDRIPGMRCVLGLQENVVTGMADGYFRVSGQPAATLLHCGPGLANGLANLHNARRAGSGIVNIVGDHATHHRDLDAPLMSDTEGWARGGSHWVRVAATAESVGADAAVATQAARATPAQIATLILPADTAWNNGGGVGPVLQEPKVAPPSQLAIRTAAKMLREDRKALLLLGGRALNANAQELVNRIQKATGCRVMAEVNNSVFPRGKGRLPIERVPYAAGPAIESLSSVENLILVSAKAPVGFFAYPNTPGRHYPSNTTVHVLSRPSQDVNDALSALVDLLEAPEAAMPSSGATPLPGVGQATSEGLARTLAACMPEGAIVVDESISFGRDLFAGTHAAPPHDWLQSTGGAIGCGLPLATGAAIGAPDRRVIALQADGSGMYTLQALWTQAREKASVTTIILSNRKYQILLGEYANVGANPGPTAMQMLDLGNPDLDWVKLAGGMGVEAARAETLEDCGDLMKQANLSSGPFLIELVI
jgi:acetolactate synthase I/II/III large subunit